MKQIKFVPKGIDSIDMVSAPRPAKFYIPEWYKTMPSFHEEQSGYPKRSTGKMCMPFLDGLVTGYIQELWVDLYVENTENGIHITWANHWDGFPEPLVNRFEYDGGQKPLLPKSNFYEPVEFQWMSNWEALLPEGYSALYTHPFSRYDLPFFTLTGIIDSDEYVSHGPVPFFLKKGFSGIIAAGTPIYQIVPIKRESWKSSEIDMGIVNTRKISSKVRKHFYGGYKKYFWKRKEYS